MCSADDTGGGGGGWVGSTADGVEQGGIDEVGGSGGGWHVPLSSYSFWCSIAAERPFFYSISLSKFSAGITCYSSSSSSCSQRSRRQRCHLFRLLFFLSLS